MVSRKSALGCTKTIPKTIQNHPKPTPASSSLKSRSFSSWRFCSSAAFWSSSCACRYKQPKTSKTYGHRYGPMEIQLRQQSNWISPIPVSASSCFLDFFFVFGMNPAALRPRRNCSLVSWNLLDTFWPVGLELYKLPMRKGRPYCTSL